MLRKLILAGLGAGFILAAVLTAVCYSAEIAYTAMVIDLQGKASVQRKENKAQDSSLNIGDVLYPKDAVSVAEKSELTINYYLNGIQEKWPEGSKFTVGDSRTENIPANVQTSLEKVTMPDWQGEDPMGGYIARDAAKIDFPEFNDNIMIDKEDMPVDKK